MSPSVPTGHRPISVLILEDHALIAIDLEALLLANGVGEVCIVSSIEEACAIIGTRPFDAALIDLRIGEDLSAPVARALRQTSVPFAIVSGYNAANAADDAFDSIPVVAKPYTEADVVGVLRALLAPGLATRTG